MSKTLKFAKIILDRLNSADDLDRVLRITSMRTWVLLTALCTVMGTAVIWSAVAVVPQKVVGSGILLKSGGILSVVAPVDGRIADVSFGAGDNVKEASSSCEPPASWSSTSSTLVNADRICVVEGRIVQNGTYSELMAQPGTFQELARRQLA